MNILTTAPQLTVEDKAKLSAYLLAALKAKNFCANVENVRYVVPKLRLFSENRAVDVVTHDYWNISDAKIYLGGTNDANMSAKDCLGVLLTLTQFVENTPELETAKQDALTRYILGEYTELSKAALIEAPVPMEGLAFSEEKVAALLGGEWMLPNGEVVDVTGEGWKVAATRLPAPVKTAVDADVQF